MVLISKYLCHKMPLIVAIKRFDSLNMYIGLHIYIYLFKFFFISSPKQMLCWSCSIYLFFLVQVQSSEMDLICLECQLFIVKRAESKWEEHRRKGVKFKCIFLINSEKFFDDTRTMIEIYTFTHNHIIRKGLKIVPSLILSLS